jgi:hypothetical protein
MKERSGVSSLLLGGAVATFVLTLVTFLSGVSTASAEDCTEVGHQIGYDCIGGDSGGGTWDHCGQCGEYYCSLYCPPWADPQCWGTCVDGVYGVGCT